MQTMRKQSLVLHNQKQSFFPEQISASNLSVYQQVSSPFCTEVKLKSGQQQDLHAYINNLRKQIKNAVWKQDLVLQYNFLPLQEIKDKILLQKQIHQQKMDRFKQQYRKIFQNEQFTTQLQNLRSFNIKLKDKTKTYEMQIEEQNIKITLLKADAQKRKQRLKQLIRANMELSKSYAQKLGATNKRDIIKLARAKSEIELQKRSSFQSYGTQRKNSLLIKRSESAKSDVRNIMRKGLFEDCLDKVIEQIRNMNTSTDIQSGIYLEVMNKKSMQLSHAGRISHRSTISNTLHKKYAPLIHKRGNKHFEQDDFDIELEDFKKLNWKQLLGVLMIKDKNCKKLKQIFKSLNIEQLTYWLSKKDMNEKQFSQTN